MAKREKKPPKQAAGTLLYRESNGQVKVLLVHPSGNYNRQAPWSIPKGVPDEGETLEQTARRETLEETGVTVSEALLYLGSIHYAKSGKEVHCFAGPAPDCAPTCASWEVDKAEFVVLHTARELLHVDQQPFIDRLEELLRKTET